MLAASSAAGVIDVEFGVGAACESVASDYDLPETGRCGGVAEETFEGYAQCVGIVVVDDVAGYCESCIVI